MDPLEGLFEGVGIALGVKLPCTGENPMENKYRALNELPLVLRVEDLMPILGIGRNTAYELIRSGQIRSIKVGRQIRVPKDAVTEFLGTKVE